MCVMMMKMLLLRGLEGCKCFILVNSVGGVSHGGFMKLTSML